MDNSIKLSILIPCYNNEDIIKECLESVKWADEILVCDSFSKDKTLDIAREYTDKIVQHEYINSATQKNWAIPQAKNDWVLIVDTDERISQELKQEILAVLKDPKDYDGFKIPRRNYSFRKALRHGGYWPDYQLRLFKRDQGRYEPREVHAGVILKGKFGYLKNPIIHLHDRNFRQVIEKYLFRYVPWEAKERLKKERPSFLKLFLVPPSIFILRYIVYRGFLDGARGLLTAGIWSVYFFLTYFYMLKWKKR